MIEYSYSYNSNTYIYMYCVARIGGTLWNRRVIIIYMSEITMLGHSADKKMALELKNCLLHNSMYQHQLQVFLCQCLAVP